MGTSRPTARKISCRRWHGTIPRVERRDESQNLGAPVAYRGVKDKTRRNDVPGCSADLDIIGTTVRELPSLAEYSPHPIDTPPA